MTEVHRLEPHDELPENGRFALVMRRFGEDAPDIAITEIIVADADPPPEVTVALRPDGNSMHFDEAVAAAVALAEERGLSVVYAVDRTGGPREAEVLSHGGDRTVGMEKLDDAAEGERGTNMQDRPPNAGYNLTPHR
jgi:hypothetical protein